MAKIYGSGPDLRRLGRSEYEKIWICTLKNWIRVLKFRIRLDLNSDPNEMHLKNWISGSALFFN